VAEYTDNGFVGLNRDGQVISVSVDANKIIPFIQNKLNNVPLSITVASRANLSGTDDLFQQQFENYFRQGNYGEAAKTVANSPNQVLRTNESLNRFKAAPGLPNQAPPLMQYLAILMEKGKLTERERFIFNFCKG
jgi:clathrin heavy chain